MGGNNDSSIFCYWPLITKNSGPYSQKTWPYSQKANNNEIQGVPKNKLPSFFKNMISNKTNALQILFYFFYGPLLKK